jgi:O6-methylguanine-DNA--protein-cysteine methyltransferase
LEGLRGHVHLERESPFMNYTYLETPIGTLLIAGDGEAVRRIDFPKDGKARAPEQDWTESARGPVGVAVKQLKEYFAGKRAEFDLPLAPEGTEFQRSVWRNLQEIPYGETISYGELAKRVGNPKASRAVGNSSSRGLGNKERCSEYRDGRRPDNYSCRNATRGSTEVDLLAGK